MAKTKLTTAEQIAQLKTLMQNFTPELMNNVHRLECPTPRTFDPLVGAEPKHSLRGYAYLLQSHRLRHHDTLSTEASDILRDNAILLQHLAKDMETLWAMQPVKPEDTNRAYQDYVATKYEELAYTENMVMIGGSPKHFTLHLMKQDSIEDTTITSYNAGDEALKSFDPRYVMGMVTRKLIASSEEQIKEFITNHTAKKFASTSQHYSILSAQTEKFLGSVTAHTDVKPQGKHNCTTRSIREFLRHQLPPELFHAVHALAANVSPLEHSILLSTHLGALEQKQQQTQTQQQLQRQVIEKLYQLSKYEQQPSPERAKGLLIALQGTPQQPSSHLQRLEKSRPSPLQSVQRR